MRLYMAVAASVALLVGCGGGDDSTTTVTEAPTEESAATTTEEASPDELKVFIEEADAICEEFNATFTELSEAEYFRQVETFIDQLEALDPPESVEIQWNQYLEAVNDQVTFGREGNDAETRAADNRKEVVAQEIGLAECGTG